MYDSSLFNENGTKSTADHIDSTIIGATKLSQLQENVDSLTVTLSDELIAAINAIQADITNPGQ